MDQNQLNETKKPSYERIQGTIFVRAVHAKDVWADEGTNSDPYFKF
jgi:hypothetical protein